MLSDTVMNYALLTFADEKAGARTVNNEFRKVDVGGFDSSGLCFSSHEPLGSGAY